MLHKHSEKLLGFADTVNPFSIYFNTVNIFLGLLIIELVCFKKITDRFLYFPIRNGMQILAHSLFSVFNSVGTPPDNFTFLTSDAPEFFPHSPQAKRPLSTFSELYRAVFLV